MYDIWDEIRDEKRVPVPLRDGSEEKIRLTLLRTTVFDQAIRTGLLKAPEIIIISRVASVIDAYNGAVSRFVSLHASFESTSSDNVSSDFLEAYRSAIYEVQNNTYEVLEGTKRVLDVWPWEESKKALNISGAGDQRGGGGVLLSIANLPKVSPAGYKAGIYEKLE